MSTLMHDVPIQNKDFTPRKRHPQAIGPQLPAKRLKTANNVGHSKAAAFSPSTKVNRAGRFKAEKWFEDTNKNASRNVQFLDNDPPFYIDRQHSVEAGSTCAMQSDSSSPKAPKFGKPTAPTRSLLAQMDSSGSSSDDYRSVIDDLTVKNKKLKKQLRQYQRLHCSHLQEEKLFEVRVHGLTSHWKRELEETLRSFASSIAESSPQRVNTEPLPARHPVAAPLPAATISSAAVDAIPSVGSLPDKRKPSSASTTQSKHLDSAYASMSGQTGPSQLQSHDTGYSDQGARISQKQQNVKSYLHNIPESLVPTDSSMMSERAKSRLVVKRLEQIFTGKKATSHFHPQASQQQEVSHLAAQADRRRFESMDRGRGVTREGVREARILPGDTELQVESMAEATQIAQRSRHSSKDGGTSARGDFSRDGSPDQRPTRPLDLDLNRVQVPADNVDYIRHLGLACPKVGSGDEGDTGDDWVFLNLLISMAQLHTLNVTPEFIRRAIINISSTFELSSDGSKVRWLGGNERTRSSSDSEDVSDSKRSKSVNSSGAVSQHSSISKFHQLALDERQESQVENLIQMDVSSTEPDTKNIRAPVTLQQINSNANFHYIPLFCHASASDDDDNSDAASESSVSSDVMETATGLNSGMNSGINSGSHGIRESEVKLRKHNAENGPIIFYHKARFCTDLSGDPSGALMNQDAYERYVQHPVGCRPDDLDQSSQSEDDPDQSVCHTAMDPEAMEPTMSALDLDNLRPCTSTIDGSTTSDTLSPFPMEVSGLGGVHPDDNFCVKVQRGLYKRSRKAGHFSAPPSGSKASSGSKVRLLAASMVSLHDDTRNHPTENLFESDIIAERKVDMEPSSLPSPSFACLPFSSSSSEASDDDDESQHLSAANNSPQNSAVRPAFKRFDTFSTDHVSGKPGKYSDASIASDDSDDSSIDLLAHMRALDPDTVAAREREFEINAAPPFDSRAATAGESSSRPSRPLDIVSDTGSMDVGGYGSDSD